MAFLKLLEGIRTPFLDSLFLLITKLGETEMTIVVMLPVFWCINKSLGYYMAFCDVYGIAINQFVKGIFKIARPWMKDPTLKTVEAAKPAATGYSFPSGHTANSVVLFGALSTGTKKTSVRWIFWLLAAAVAFSRLYLGVHSPADVLFSIGISIILLVAVDRLIKSASKKPIAEILLVCVPILLGVGLTVYCNAENDGTELALHGVKNAYTVLGISVGLAVSRFFDRKFIEFKTEAPPPVQFFKLIVGAALVFAIKTLLKKPLYSLFAGSFAADGVRYFIIIIFACLIWPATFSFWVRLFGKIKKD